MRFGLYGLQDKKKAVRGPGPQQRMCVCVCVCPGERETKWVYIDIRILYVSCATSWFMYVSVCRKAAGTQSRQRRSDPTMDPWSTRICAQPGSSLDVRKSERGLPLRAGPHNVKWRCARRTRGVWLAGHGYVLQMPLKNNCVCVSIGINLNLDLRSNQVWYTLFLRHECKPWSSGIPCSWWSSRFKFIPT